MHIFGYLRGPGRGLQWLDWAYLALQVSSHPYLCTCEIRKQDDKYFLSSNPKYENKNHFFIHIELKVTKYSGSKTLSQSRQMYNKGKQGTNVAHNVRGGLLIDLTIVAIALLLRYTLSISLKLTDITQWNVGAVVLEQF